MTAGMIRKLHQFTVHQYDQMVAAGVFDENTRVELLDGEIIVMAAMGVRHATCLVNFDYLLKRQVPREYRVAGQIPILLDDMSEPEPDLVVYRPRRRTTPPIPADILLVVEIADSSLDYDRNQKFPRYAAAGIPEAWLLDLTAGILERHSAPYAGRFRSVVTVRADESLDSTVLPGLSLPVDEILAEEW
ncbi:MAG TPA: Uma2 family endonuclease [Thermomicrobiales bacterium]|jgi:Uma2 family endonuclease